MTWVYLSLDSTQGIQFSSPSPLFFHVRLIFSWFLCCWCRLHTCNRELELLWGSGASSRCVPSSFLVAGSQEGAVQWGANTDSHNPCSARLTTESCERRLLSCLFLHQLSALPIPLHSSHPRIQYFCRSTPWSAIATTDVILWTVQPGLIPEFAPFPVRMPLKTKTKQNCIPELVVKTSLLTYVKVFLPSQACRQAVLGSLLQECWHLENLPEAGTRAAAKPASLAGGDAIFMPHRSYLLRNPTLQQTWKHMASVNCMKIFGRKTIFQEKWKIKPNQAMFFPFNSHY